MPAAAFDRPIRISRPASTSSTEAATGIAHWHQLKAVANRSHSASRPQSRASQKDSTGGASRAQNVASVSESADRPSPCASISPPPTSGKAISGARLPRKACTVSPNWASPSARPRASRAIPSSTLRLPAPNG